MSRIQIPRQIEPKEILVRLLKTPFHYDPKRKVILKEALTPSSREVEKVVINGQTISMPGVSLLRLSYTDANTCKKHAQHILSPSAERTESFAGLLLFKPEHIAEICEDNTAKALEEAKIVHDSSVLVAHGTPMDDSTPEPKYIPEPIPVYTDTPGNPMHADLIYNFPRPEKGVPNNPVNKLAKMLVDKGLHKFDHTEDPDIWAGDDLTI